MKKLVLSISLVAAMMSAACMAQEGAPEAAPTAPAVSKMAEAIPTISFFNGTPSTTAEYYIYLQSASWCGPCNMEMPKVVQQYNIMKQEGRVEIILVSADKDLPSANKFLTRYGAKFSGIMYNREDAGKLPGFIRARTIPHATLVTADGKLLHDGHAAFIGREEWKEMIEKHEAANKK